MSGNNKLRLKVLRQELCDVLYQLKDRELLDILANRPDEADRLRALLGELDKRDDAEKGAEGVPP